MRRLRPLIALIFVLWAVLLAVPMGRVNFVLQATRSGYTKPDEDADDPFVYDYGHDSHLYTNNSCLDSDALPDSASILAQHSNGPAVVLGLLIGPTLDQIKILDGLIAAHPRDASLIAARLTRSCQHINVGRYDNPFDDSNWPKPSGSDDGPPASPRADWLAFLALANRGGSLEPNNTFFDWMRIASLLALHRDSEALAVLSAAAGKTAFDDHVKAQTQDTIRAFEISRPLTPVEFLGMGHSIFEEDPVLTRTFPCIMGHVVEFRQNGQDGEAVRTAYNLLKLGRVLREHAYLIRGSVDGFQAELEAISNVQITHRTPGTWPVPRKPPSVLVLTSTGNLGGYALSLKQTAIAREATAEWLLRGGEKKLELASFFQNPVLPWANLAGLQERWGRILLHSLPLTFILLLVSMAAARRWTAPEEAPAFSSRAGVIAGVLVLAILAVGDSFSAFASTILMGPGFRLALEFDRSPGLYATERWMVIGSGSGAGVFVLLSFASARRWQRRGQLREPWLAQLKGALFQRNQQWRLNLTPLFQFIALATIWLCLEAAYLGVCVNSGITDGRSREFVSGDGGAGAAIVWTLFFVVAAIRWFRLPDRREALGLVFLNLRRLTTGYLLAALLIYPITALAILPVDWKFDQEYQKYLQMGDAAWVRHELGL